MFLSNSRKVPQARLGEPIRGNACQGLRQSSKRLGTDSGGSEAVAEEALGVSEREVRRITEEDQRYEPHTVAADAM